MARLPRGGGRRKTELKRIKNERERAVTFTKRHNGLFKKANELATLCGVQIGVILFSLSGKPLSFGSPNVLFVINKFLNSNQVNQQADDFVKRFIDSYHESKVKMLNQELDELNEKLANEKKRGQRLQQHFKASTGWDTYEEYIKSLGIHGLMKLKYKLEELKRNVERNSDAISGSSSSNDEYEADLSKIGAPKDFLKM
ncbi:hypothetical protein L1887_20932 [Cichorium endivia]|nr:hypothetical protein L1887_20932 [Cichorium endivia]